MVGGMAWHGMAGRRKRVQGQAKRTSLFSIAFTPFVPYNPLLAMLNAMRLALHIPLHPNSHLRGETLKRRKGRTEVA